MAFTRQDRTLSGGKSNIPLIRKGVPDSREGFHGDLAFVEIDGIGIVQYVKIENIWKQVGSQVTTQAEAVKEKMIADEEEVSFDTSGLIKADGSVPFTGNQSHGGFNITNVGSLTASATVQAEQLTSTDDASIGDALDVDGPTTLDKTTIDTTDGAFAVSGANQIILTTTGSNTAGNLDVNVGFNYELDVTRTCDWNTAATDWDNSSTFALTSLGDTTIETLGTTSSPKTLSLIGGLSDFSKFGLVAISSFIQKTEDGDTTDNQGANGIHIKCDAGNTAGKHNNIFIEQKNQSQKGSGYGINLKSSNGIKIETSNNLTSQPTSIIMEAPANGTIDIGLGSLSPNATPNRIMVHGVFETSNLYRPSGSIITTDIGTGLNGTASGEHVRFQALDTYNLIRAVSRVVKNSTTLFTDNTCDTTNGSSTVQFTSTGNANAGLISDGMKVTGPGIPTNSFVTNKGTNSFDLRNASNSSVTADNTGGTNVTLSFFNYTNTLYNNDFILITTIIDNDDDDAIGTMWKISITYQAGGNDYAQVWYCAKQSAKFAWLGNSNYNATAGLTLSADDKGIVTWTSTNGIRWQNATGGTVTSVRCSALKIHSGTNDF